MKRIFTIFMSLFLIASLLAIPVAAAEEIFFEYPEYLDAGVEVYIPEGTYFARLYVDDQIFDSSTFTIQYSPMDTYYDNDCVVSTSDIHLYGEVQQISIVSRNDFTCTYIGILNYLDYEDDGLLDWEIKPAFIPGPFSLIPVASSPALSDVVNPHMMSGVLDQVVSLLPAILGVLVAYIGIRKAVSWLQSVLHSS